MIANNLSQDTDRYTTQTVKCLCLKDPKK